ncbi:MAG TPA: hypothetical protein ENJ18_02625 [Nannocystis exedens]|nr:hypothetical protein [Nannocystis exedens]
MRVLLGLCTLTFMTITALACAPGSAEQCEPVLVLEDAEAIRVTGPTGLAADKALAELSPEERATACENIREHRDASLGEARIVRDSCIYAGIYASSEPLCTATFASCVQQPKAKERSDSRVCELAQATTCRATVAELEACLLEQVSDRIDFIDSFSCAAIYSGEFERFALPRSLPNCAALSRACPEFF